MVVRWQFEDYWKGQTKTVTFRSSGAAQDFVVPDTVDTLRATLRGGAGGGENIDAVSEGGYLVCDIPVTAGETLRVRVGGSGARVIPGLTGATGGFNGGGPGGNAVVSPHTGGYGGGGASDIRQNGDDLASRIAIAAGGGANSGESISHRGGSGGPDVGQQGYSDNGGIKSNESLYGGHGGSQTAGGAHGTNGGSDGSLGQGGTGRGSAFKNGSGGGGGGLYGGGGGGSTGVSGDGAGGGGGSNGASDAITVLADARGRAHVYPDDPYISLAYNEDTDVYVFDINPNDGGSPSITKNIAMSQNVGPNRNNILQEGQNQAPAIAFSGVILYQDQYEALEQWFDKRIFIKLTDDLNREFYGLFSKFSPKRQRRAHNFWYHTYDAEFQVSAYRNASGAWVYGRVD